MNVWILKDYEESSVMVFRTEQNLKKYIKLHYPLSFYDKISDISGFIYESKQASIDGEDPFFSYGKYEVR